jgi:hypothetical protein
MNSVEEFLEYGTISQNTPNTKIKGLVKSSQDKWKEGKEPELSGCMFEI